MKRKRKHKKGKAKGASAAGPKAAVSSSVNVENDSGLEEFDKDENNDSGMEIETPSSTATDNQPHNDSDVNPDGSIAKGVEKPLGRVTVKLKKPKVIESQVTSSDAPTQSDADKSSQQVGFERRSLAAEKTEDSADSLAEAQVKPATNSTKKPGSIKIKSSKVLGSNNSNEALPPTRDGSPLQKELKKPPHQGHRRYDQQELDTALMVIKKVMKMDAAEPFNVPVNPVALGIPDYFDVIDMPMDFGTICENLEKGAKYANSEDVYKDVQYIWDNCFKYNNKGDYILDLMKRVKKNFTKYWTTAGLYSEQQIGTNGVESSQEKIAPTTGQIKVYVKGGLSKKTSKKGHGRRHKSDCLCAICILKRRRREREENARIAQGQIGESSPAGSPSGENSASDMDESTVDPNAAEVEQKDVKMEESKQPGHSSDENEEDDDNHENNENDEAEENDVEMKDKDNSEATEPFDKSGVDANKQSSQEPAEKSGDEKGVPTVEQPKHKDLEEKPPKIKANQLKLIENPMILELSGTLFPDIGKKSIWSGPHSLINRRSTARSTTCIQAAIDMLMKQAH